MDTLTVNFGKYRGKQIAEIWEVDKQYAKWLYPQEILIGEYPDIKKFLDEKLRGSAIKWIYDKDKGYIAWLIKNDFVNSNCPRLKKELDQLTQDE
ncbi:unnamed protein product [Phytophthora lilii]|uniref:Unnamed protein product n=1 Tax=Phytophthora lilii TaxID=2077276 RepID=A0A9W7D0T7_9STRA|nr:unnamed protein product [Phytophthora lilii]